MHRRQLLILQAGLLLAAGLLAWRLETEWKQANHRYYVLSSASAKRESVGLSPAGRREPPATAEIIAKNLFFPDRTNLVAPP